MDDDVIEDRLGLMRDRIEHAFDRIETLERRLDAHTNDMVVEETQETETRRERRGVIFELIVIGLVAIETILTALMFFRHA